VRKLKLAFRPDARRDLAKIIRYIAEKADLSTAERYNLRIDQGCESLLDALGMGAPYGRKPGIRKINEGPYKIFYRVTESEIIILRLWDGRRGTEPAFVS
jgi:plasmid stabilization system protein ParE